MWMVGHCTTTLATGDLTRASLLATPVAVLLTVAQSAWVVVEVMWTVGSLATPRVPAKLQFSTWVPTGPVIEQPVTAGLMLQFRSVPAGSGSVMVTPVAVPGPLLLTTTSKPMLSPALTGPAGLAVLVMWITAHCTSTLAVAVSWPSLLAAPVAVLLTVAQSSLVVAEVMCTVASLATPRVPAKLQPSTWVPAGPVIAQPVTAGLRQRTRLHSGRSQTAYAISVVIPEPLLLTT